MNAALKWSKKNSPVAFFVLSMNGKWGVPGENPMNIVSAFKRLWPELRTYLKTAATMNYADGGRLRTNELEINFPQNQFKTQINNDFFLLLKDMSKYLDEAEDYETMETYCRDMLSLFVWSEENRDIWKGSIVYSMDKQERYEEAYQFYNSLPEKGVLVASMYALSVLARCDVERAEEILDPYRDSTDPAISDRIQLLNRLKAINSSLTKPLI